VVRFYRKLSFTPSVPAKPSFQSHPKQLLSHPPPFEPPKHRTPQVTGEPSNASFTVRPAAGRARGHRPGSSPPCSTSQGSLKESPSQPSPRLSPREGWQRLCFHSRPQKTYFLQLAVSAVTIRLLKCGKFSRS